MHRDQIVEGLAEAYNLTKADARRILDTILDTIVDEAKAGRESSFPGFGKFKPVVRAARNYSSPIAGQGSVPAKKTLVFRPSIAIKETLNS